MKSWSASRSRATAGYSTGGQIRMPGGEWPIVGTFSSGGDAIEGWFLGDSETVLVRLAHRSLRRRAGAALVDAGAYPAFEKWLRNESARCRSKSNGKPTSTRRQVGRMVQVFTRIFYGIGMITALGALFGAVKILYAAVRARTREIGTLRALGFGGGAVAISVLVESLALSLLGAAIGAFVAWLLFDGRVVFVWGVFQLQVPLHLDRARPRVGRGDLAARWAASGDPRRTGFNGRGRCERSDTIVSCNTHSR